MSGQILIWGAGAIGGTVGAYLVRAGENVLFVDRAGDHVAAIAKDGLQIVGPIETFQVKAPAVLPSDLTGKFDTVFLCTKAPDTAAAVETLAPFVAEDGYVVSLQNGLNELVIAAKSSASAHDRRLHQFRRRLSLAGRGQYSAAAALSCSASSMGAARARLQALHALVMQI